jgi:thiol-disulfide isomerase/thioredoxin
MKKYLLVIFQALCLTAMANNKSNVQINIKVDNFINSVEQMLYVYQLEGNEYTIDDSIKIEPGRNNYVVHANLPYEMTVKLLFSKRGPLHMQILACPGDKLEMEITETDNKIGISEKHLLKGTPQNDAYVDFWNKIHTNNVKRKKAENDLTVYGISDKEKAKQQAIVDSCKKADIEHMRQTIHLSMTPEIILTALNFIEEEIPVKEYRDLLNTAYHRFPNYYPLKLKLTGGNWPDMTEKSEEIYKFIKGVERARIMQKSINIPKSDTLKLGQTLELLLVDSLGKQRQLSDFRGKFVLIEVWASWCIPCIHAMPSIIHAQKTFTDDFICCAISIDKDALAWKNCIIKEGLQPLHHFKGTDNKGELYNDIKSLVAKGVIPQNYLLNRNGNIIAINIYGEQLIKKLETLINQ